MNWLPKITFLRGAVIALYLTGCVALGETGWWWLERLSPAFAIAGGGLLLSYWKFLDGQRSSE